jgi:citrate lyase subunit beta / citryl-CoA lyase
MQALRSMLFTPGNRLDLIEKASRSGTDAVIVDLEDAVAIEAKPQARENLASLPDSPVPWYVRTNAGNTEFLWDDIVAAGRADIAGLVIPKVEDPELMLRVDGALTALELSSGREPGAIHVIPLIESAIGVHRCYDILTATDRVQSVLFASGEQGDLVADLGCTWTPEGTGLMHTRSAVLMAARAAGIQRPLEAVFMDFRDMDALRVECELAATLGYTGKVAIHPAQIPVIHEVFTPSADEVAAQTRIVEAFEQAEAEGLASINVDGRMVDYAVARVARAILARAEAAERTANRTA